jgi:S-adenosylmethionine/arginine decarboxylase-like enzyme
MKPFGDPQILHFGDGPRAGYTLVQLIHTSCITGHFCDESDSAYIDVFSCKPFEPSDVQKVVSEFFGPEYSKRYFTTRGAYEEHTRAQSPGADVLGGRPLI